MANLLLIEKQTGGYFKFTLNGDTANAVTSIYNDLLTVGNQLHFKTGNGANIIKEQFIYPEDVTVVASGTFTFTTVAQVWDKLIDIDYFAWLGNGGGGGGVDRFDDLVDTFKYTGNAGKTVIVDNSELRLVPVTLYNKRLFTELEDTPSSLVPNKMLVVNPAGTAVVLQDQPQAPEALLNSIGYFDYNDLITQTIPLVAIANTPLKLTNDSEGANTSTDQNPYGVSYVWDYTTNQFNFSELSVGDTIDVRIHVQITTTSANQKVSMSAKFGIGSVSEFTNAIYENQFKSSGLHEVSFVAPFYMGSEYITDYPAELYLTTDASATVKVDGWYIRILRKNINVITVDYTVPDATTLAKGIVRLAGDLSGTANAPTVPELANKVPNTRTVSTTSPLLGGGALSSDLTLSIQQANSTQSGFISYVDWANFEAKQSALSGTGFVKVSGSTVSYDNNTYSLDSDVVKLTGNQTIDGIKTFTDYTKFTDSSATGGLWAVEIDVNSNDALVVKDGGTVRFQIGRNGEALGQKYKVSGGFSNQFLKANGDLDSTSYQPLLTNPITGTGTTNYVPKFTGSTALGNSLIYDNGTNVFVGGSGSNGNRFTVVEGGTTLVGQQILMQNASSANDALNIVHSGTGKLIKGTKGVEVFNITNSGGAYFADSVGIGITPSAWDTSLWKVLQLSYGSLYSSIYSNVMAHNLYVAGEDTKYISSNLASQYEQNSGAHWWSTAPTGTAGANVTLTPRMILDNSGNLGIGITSPTGQLDVYTSIYKRFTVSYPSTLETKLSVGLNGYIKNDDGNEKLTLSQKAASGTIVFNTGSSDSLRMSITHLGQVLINTTTSTTGGVNHPLIVKGTSISSQGVWVEANPNDAAVFIDHSGTVGKIGTSYRTSAGFTPLTFMTSGEERMRINTEGNVGIGIVPQFSIPTYRSLEIGLTGLIYGRSTSDSGTMTVGSNLYYNGGWKYKVNGGGSLISQNEGTIAFETAPSGTSGSAATITERMRITSGGATKMSNDGTYLNSTASYHEIRQSVNNTNIALFTNTTASPYGPSIYFPSASPNNTTNYFLAGSDTSGNKFFIWSNGSIVNSTGSYGTISDIKYKENIIDASSKLDDILQLKVRNFNFIGDETKQIGFIAQEFEEVFPNMIDISTEKVEEGVEPETYKSIKTSVLTPILVKAMQELAEQVKELKAEIEILKNK